MSRITLRRATAADAALLAVLAERTFRATFTGQNSPQDMDTHCAENFSVDIQTAELADPQRLTLLAEAGKTPAGFAQLVLGHAPRGLSCVHPAELNRLYVLGEWHGRGVAHELMAAVLSAAAAARSDRSRWEFGSAIQRRSRSTASSASRSSANPGSSSAGTRSAIWSWRSGSRPRRLHPEYRC